MNDCDILLQSKYASKHGPRCTWNLIYEWNGSNIRLLEAPNRKETWEVSNRQRPEEISRDSKQELTTPKLLKRVFYQSFRAEGSPKWQNTCWAWRNYKRSSGCKEYWQPSRFVSFDLYPARRSANQWQKNAMEKLQKSGVCLSLDA